YVSQLLPTATLSLPSQYDIHLPHLHSFPTRRSSDLIAHSVDQDRRRRINPSTPTRSAKPCSVPFLSNPDLKGKGPSTASQTSWRSEEHTSELQSLRHLVCRLLLEKKKKIHKK